MYQGHVSKTSTSMCDMISPPTVASLNCPGDSLFYSCLDVKCGSHEIFPILKNRQAPYKLFIIEIGALKPVISNG